MFIDVYFSQLFIFYETNVLFMVIVLMLGTANKTLLQLSVGCIYRDYSCTHVQSINMQYPV